MKNVNYKKTNGTTGHIQINDDEEIVVVSKGEAQELNTNEEPLLNPGIITNESTENVEPYPEKVQKFLNRNEETDEEPMLPTGLKAE